MEQIELDTGTKSQQVQVRFDELDTFYYHLLYHLIYLSIIE